jgi:oligopeptide/dipeptide ABC transporter ATP-binding protein
MSDSNQDGALLTVRNLRTWFKTEDGLVKAVDGVSFKIPRRKTFALVGESGCGKSVTAFSILRLLAMPPALITSDAYLRSKCGPPDEGTFHYLQQQMAPSEIVFEGTNLLELSEGRMRSVRGGKISMIFQEPMSSLNPVYTCGNQIVEAIGLHRKLPASEAIALAVDLLAKVGIPEPAQRYKEYPHQLSGGMRQRVMIAMALSCNPRLLIADEPTTALDVTIQAQILELLRQVQQSEGLSIMLITHDLAVVAQTADVVGVMYASKLAELTDVGTLFTRPMHPYTQGLFRSLPRLGQKKDRLETIAGNVPNPLHFPAGCKFHTRCLLTQAQAAGAPAEPTAVIDSEGSPVRVLARCAAQEPPLREIAKGHWCACWEAQGYENAPQTDPAA